VVLAPVTTTVWPSGSPLEGPHLGAEVGPELVREEVPGPLERGQRVALPARAVEREDEEAPPVLAQRVVRDQALQVGDDLVLPAEGQPRLELCGEGSGAQLGQPPSLGHGERRVRPVLVRLSPPEADGGGEHPLGSGGVAGAQQRPAAGHQLADAQRVELVGGHRQGVAGAPPDDQAPRRAARPLGFQGAAQAHEVDLQRLASGRRTLAVPERLGEPVHAHGTRGSRGEQRQQEPLLGAWRRS
jgi:hypothetical protein